MENYYQSNSTLAIRLGTIINNKKYYLSCHRFYQVEKHYPTKIIIMFHNQLLEGQKWKLIQKYKGLYYISYDLNDYAMKDWKLYFDIESRNIYLSKNLKSLWKLEKIDQNKFYIKDALYGYSINLSIDNKRDINSYYGSISKDENQNVKNVFFIC